MTTETLQHEFQPMSTAPLQAAAGAMGPNGMAIEDNRPVRNNAPATIQRQANGTGLPDNLKSGIENLSGMSMDHVQVHYNSAQPAQLNAHAYAQGSQIHVAPGQEKHLPHEAWHVVQQAQGRVRPTVQMLKRSGNVASSGGGVYINDNRSLEREADVMGEKAVQINDAHTAHINAVNKPSVADKDATVLRKEIFADGNGKVVQCVRPGDAPPSLQSQLTERFKQIKGEANITEPMIIQQMIALMQAQVVAPAPIVVAHPLQPLPPGLVDNMVAIALHAQLQQNNAAIGDMTAFKNEVVNRTMAGFGAHGADAYIGEIIPQLVPAIDGLIDPFFHQAEHTVLTDPAQNSSHELRAASAAVGPGADLAGRAATAYLANANRPALAAPNPIQQQQLRVALRNMPIVKSMLAGTLGQEDQGGQPAQLINGMEEAPGAAISAAIIGRIQQAMGVLGHLVDSNVLPPQGRVPNIQINPDPVRQIPQSAYERFMNIQRTIVEPFRADANRANNRVRISALSELDTIVHEFGHQIEFALPAEQWLDIQDLLRMRHQGGNLIAIYPDHADPAVRDEAALNAVMPATGRYSAKVYDDGSTEVMSMTLEYFSTPDKATQMINNDPLQAAIILRIIKPNEFNNYVPHHLRDLLPRGDISPGVHPMIPHVGVPGLPVGAQVGDEIGNDML